MYSLVFVLLCLSVGHVSSVSAGLDYHSGSTVMNALWAELMIRVQWRASQIWMKTLHQLALIDLFKLKLRMSCYFSTSYFPQSNCWCIYSKPYFQNSLFYGLYGPQTGQQFLPHFGRGKTISVGMGQDGWLV